MSDADPAAASPREPIVVRDGAELGNLLAANLPAIHAFVRLRMNDALRDLETSADLVQSVCREILEAPGSAREFPNQRAFRGWLAKAVLRTVQNRHRHWFRANKRDAKRLARDSQLLANVYRTVGSASRHAAAREDRERFERAFAQLPRDAQWLITEARILERPHAEIAAELGIQPEALRARLYRAVSRLSELVAGEAG